MEHADSHTDFETLCAGYVLDALSDAETAQFEAMLQEATPEQQALYEDMQLVHGDLALATEAHDPPAHIETGIMASIQKDVRPTPSRTRTDRAAVQRGAGTPTWVYQGVAVALLLAVIGVSIWATQLRTTVQQQQATITQLEDEVAQQDELLTVLAAREARLVSMGGLDPSPEGYGKVLWAPEQRRAVFQIANVPPPPEDKDYQLWFIKDDESPVSAGVFHFNESSEELFFVVDELTATPSPASNTFAVTLEPKGGAPQPSGDMFLMGQQT